MKSRRYNFDNPGTSSVLRTEIEDHRVNFRIGKSCGACKFFVGTSSTGKKGHCSLGKLTEVHAKLRGHGGTLDAPSRYIAMESLDLPRVYSVNVCDNFLISATPQFIANLEHYTGEVYNAKGDVLSNLSEEKREQLQANKEEDDDDIFLIDNDFD